MRDFILRMPLSEIDERPEKINKKPYKIRVLGILGINVQISLLLKNNIKII